MSIGAVLNIAKTALSSQKYAMDVTGHNIANASTRGYSRQRIEAATAGSEVRDGMLLGRGVDPGTVARLADGFINEQLLNQESGLASAQEMELYAQNLEAYFSESGGAGFSGMMGEFWNRWHDVANDPAGLSERTALIEYAQLMNEKLAELSDQMVQMDIDLTRAVSSGLERINQITDQIAGLNTQILQMETRFPANDLRDRREILLTELGRYIDVKTFEQESGILTVASARGSILVGGGSAFHLKMGGGSGDRVIWEGSGTNTMDITDHISAGKLGGWLDMRDEVLAQVRLNLDAFADAFVWEVNRQHSQGVGLKLFDPGTVVAGTYSTDAGLAGLDFGDRISYPVDGMTLWIEDRTVAGSPVMNRAVIDLSGLDGTSSLTDLADAVNDQIAAAGLSGVTASVSGNALALTTDDAHALGFSDDNSGLLAALGINTFFTGAGASAVDINPSLSDRSRLAAGVIDAAGAYAPGDNINAMSMTGLQHASMSFPRWTCERTEGNEEGQVSTTLEGYYHSLIGGIGITAGGISRSRSFKTEMVGRISEMRDSVSGVSLDEEMANLIGLQHAFAAAARMIGTADEMMQELLNLK